MDGFGVELEGFLSVFTPYLITHIPIIYAPQVRDSICWIAIGTLAGRYPFHERGFINRLGAFIGSR